MKAGRGSGFAEDVVDDGDSGLVQWSAEAWSVWKSKAGSGRPSFWLKRKGSCLPRSAIATVLCPWEEELEHRTTLSRSISTGQDRPEPNQSVAKTVALGTTRYIPFASTVYFQLLPSSSVSAPQAQQRSTSRYPVRTLPVYGPVGGGLRCWKVRTGLILRAGCSRSTGIPWFESFDYSYIDHDQSVHERKLRRHSRVAVLSLREFPQNQTGATPNHTSYKLNTALKVQFIQVKAVILSYMSGVRSRTIK